MVGSGAPRTPCAAGGAEKPQLRREGAVASVLAPGSSSGEDDGVGSPGPSGRASTSSQSDSGSARAGGSCEEAASQGAPGPPGKSLHLWNLAIHFTKRGSTACLARSGRESRNEHRKQSLGSGSTHFSQKRRKRKKNKIPDQIQSVRLRKRHLQGLSLAERWQPRGGRGPVPLRQKTPLRGQKEASAGRRRGAVMAEPARPPPPQASVPGSARPSG
ncbi:PREDICTED: sodium/potassium-transporting ATPase subunit gamma isoform X3 [Myotis brandtii]|uniref:sodium/potassium-transporting ATPase subunit gamma isoform X3 n=1 Tax=Myotis brandtii TaxID=109478 RepID=UPI0003BB7138|nr:PREDICTED: sodium/potassium-transporting ATPase subunit gamma isoform X3 [Myotis brandtii]